MSNESVFDKKGLFVFGPKDQILADLEETTSVKEAMDSKNDFLLIGRHSGYNQNQYVWAGIKLNPEAFIKNTTLLFWNKLILKYSKSRCTHFLDYSYNSYMENNFSQHITIAINVKFSRETFDDFLKMMFKLVSGLELTYCQITNRGSGYEAFIVLLDRNFHLLKEYEKEFKASKLFTKNGRSCVNVYFYQNEECFRIINRIRELNPFVLRKENQIN